MKCIEDEIPFEVPEGWAWARLQYIISLSSGKTIKVRQLTDEGDFPVYGGNGINGMYSYYNVEPKTIVIGRVGYYCGSVYKTISKAWVTDNALIATIKEPNIFDIDFLVSTLTYLNLGTTSVSTAQPVVSGKGILPLIVPIPPKKEQNRILRQIKKIAPLLDAIENSQKETLSLIANTKSKILDLAIRGKLVPQDPNDEPASVLLERMRAEKEELIKQGKIKRDKKESVIFKGDDNSYYEKVGNNVNCIDEKIPFELPEGWAFIRLNTAWELISGRDLSPSEYNDKNDGIPYITGASNFRNGYISLVRWTTVPQVITRRGDLLLTCKGTIGEIAHNNFGEAHIARQIMAIHNNYSLNVDFLALCIEYSMPKIKQAAKGLIPGISREDILSLVIPIPPIKEQENICNKLKVTFSAIEHIEKSLN